MATSGTYIWNPDLAEIVDEAFERCRMDPALITGRHIRSARRSMRFMLADWATEEFHDFRVETLQLTTQQGIASYTDPDMPAHILDIIEARIRRDGMDTPVQLISRSEYAAIPDKSTEGRPDRVFVDKQIGGIVAHLWPIPENDTDVIFFDAVRKFQDSANASDTQDIPDYLFDAFAYGLASRLCEKFGPPELEEKLFLKARDAFKRGSAAARAKAQIRLGPGRARRR